MSDIKELKKILEDAISRKNRQDAEKDRQEMIKIMGKDLVMSLSTEDRKQLIDGIGRDMANGIVPLIAKLAEQSKISKDEIIEGIRQAISEIEIDVPHIEIPEIKIPKIEVPKIEIPPIKIPSLEWPNSNMPIEGWVRLQGIDLNNPLPVQLRDKDGKPVNLLENLTTIIGGGGGGKHDYFTIKGFNQSAYSELTNADGRLKVSVETGGTGLTDSELRASHLDVQQVSGSIDSVYVVGAFGSTVADSVFNADNRLRVSVETGGSGLTDAELRASAVPISQVSGARWSTEATQGTSPWVVSATDLDIRDLVNATDSVSVYQVSGANWSVYATGFGASIGATILNGEGASLDPRDRNWTITETVAVSGALDTVKASGIARTTNPTAVSDGDNQRISTDDLGRQLVRPIQVRDLTLTAYATLTNGTETTLKAAVAGSYLDLIYVMGANNSDVAVTVDIRAVTAGNVVMSIQIPANGTAGIACPVPLPQDETGNNWTADMADITGTTVYLTALFSREI